SILQVRAAAGRVRDDRLRARRAERRRDGLRALEPLLAPAGVERERTAAAVVRRRHLVPVRGEDARRSPVDLAEQHALHAAREPADAAAAGGGGGGLAGRRGRFAPGRRELAEGAERREARKRERRAHHPRTRQHRERERAQRSLRRWPAHFLLDALARELD